MRDQGIYEILRGGKVCGKITNQHEDGFKYVHLGSYKCSAPWAEHARNWTTGGILSHVTLARYIICANMFRWNGEKPDRCPCTSLTPNKGINLPGCYVQGTNRGTYRVITEDGVPMWC